MKQDNYLRTVHFDTPDFIPMTFHINDACWHHYDQQQLFDLMEAHPMLFPDFKRPQGVYTPVYAKVARRDEPFVDDFGCVWETADDGITGTVTGHPLADYAALAHFTPPYPEVCMGIGPIDWKKEERRIAEAHSKGQCAIGALRHGHTFLQLSDLRGYQNLLFDMMDDEPRLWQVIEMVEHFNAAIVDHYLALGADQISYPEDLGMQVGPMLSPECFLQYIFPSYKRLMAKSQQAGKIVHMHSDGDIRQLVEYLTHGGVQIINLQDRVNGIDWIREHFHEKVCIELDIDRQYVTVEGTPREIDDWIRMEVETLGSKKGGLMMIYGLYPRVPVENAAAVMDAMEKYAGYYA